ncbi:putative mucin [Phlyctema vagabunda]|uniref:Mucin n=1 Tax=Phlyctema vagabunda TaxID=108571 RepID=A0ABR4PBY3_9HELO
MTANAASSNMPYNTRRKSLSLPSLGIHLPVTHASRAAARATPPSTAEQHPTKKVKRSHEDSQSMSPPPKRERSKYDNTPPPSPEAEEMMDVDEVGSKQSREIDLEGIKDEIVEGVIVQLQKTGNRPHLVKELAAILSGSVKIVEQSANPSAIISSRLATYLKRPCWSTAAPCPLAKELETVHPRRTYFYLTTYPHQPIPDPSNPQFVQRVVVTPSLSSDESRTDEADAERRRELSPSPEVDLSSTEFDDDDLATPPTPTGSFSGRTELQRRNHRAASPPLEKDEKEFTQTARGMQKRKLSGDSHMIGAPSEVEHYTPRQFDGEALFGEGRHGNLHPSVFASSPAMKPSASSNMLKRPFEEPSDIWSRIETVIEWDSRSPENIELEELDGLLDDF